MILFGDLRRSCIGLFRLKASSLEASVFRWFKNHLISYINFGWRSYTCSSAAKRELSARRLWERIHGDFTFSTQWCCTPCLVAEVFSTVECLSSSLAAKNFNSTFRYGAVLALLSVRRDARLTLLIGARLALRLGEDSDSKLTSRLASAMLPNFKGILPLSSCERQSCASTAPKALRGAFCFAFHTRLVWAGLGSGGTYLALYEMPLLLASVETKGSWSEVRPIARTIEADFCSAATGALATKTFLCSVYVVLDYPQRGVSRTSLGQSGWPSSQR